MMNRYCSTCLNFYVSDPCDRCYGTEENHIHYTPSFVRIADVVEVVRCKDCEFRKPTNLHPNEWFCPRRTMPMHEKDLDGYCDEGKRKETKDEGDR